ncbi:MAG: Tim44-like domain-containing protein [Methylophilaceae bacterium]
MRRFLMLLTVTLTCLSLFAPVAEAKRLGGGGSFGKQRAITQKQAQNTPEPAPAKPASAPATAGGNKWLGPLAGLAIGAGLASLFAGSGLGGAMGSMLLALLAAGAVLFLISRFRNSQRPAMQYAGAGAPYRASDTQQQPVYVGSHADATATSFAANIPHDFPVDKFLRNAKASFIRLQAANDRKDLNDIRDYTTPEMFAEISMQMQERGDAAQKTDVISINAELLEVADEKDFSIASVRFTGQLRENNGAPEIVDEIWHVQKDLRDDKAAWLIAGLQQAVTH